MDTIKKQCMICDKEYDGIYSDCDYMCDECIEKVCDKISKKYSKELVKTFSGFKKTSSEKDMPYIFGSANFFINKPFFIPVIVCGDSIQFHNSEEDRNKIIEQTL